MKEPSTTDKIIRWFGLVDPGRVHRQHTLVHVGGYSTAADAGR
jgi:hypothetical protein